MKSKRLLFLLATLLSMILLLAACQDSPLTTPSAVSTQPEGDLSQTTSEATDLTTKPQHPETLTSLKIGNNDISEYTIVYAESEFTNLLKLPQNRPYFPVYDFDKETATRLSEIIKQYLGLELPVVSDADAQTHEKEILIGKTNRKSVTSALKLSSQKSDSYTIGVYENQLAICGNVYGTTWHALDHMEELFRQSLAEDKTDFVFDADFSYQGKHHMIRIGCIGDSITAGVGSTDSGRFAYPAQLGRYLWKDAIVTNYGNSGKTMRNDLNDAYNKTNEYKSCLNAAHFLDVVTIMLGTNDSNRDRSWSKEDDELYNASCKEMMDAILKKNKNIQFVLCTCPAYFGNDGFASTRVVSLVKKLVTNLSAENYAVTLFDMRKATASMKDLYPDTLHPNNQGHMEMAEAFSAALQALIETMNGNAEQ